MSSKVIKESKDKEKCTNNSSVKNTGLGKYRGFYTIKNRLILSLCGILVAALLWVLTEYLLHISVRTPIIVLFTVATSMTIGNAVILCIDMYEAKKGK